MATAISVKTESGDHYLYCFNGKLSKRQAMERVKEILEDEYPFICDVQIAYSE